MKPSHFAAALSVAVLLATGVEAQNHQQFNDHDRQVIQDWYNQHQKNAPQGFRSRDRLSADQESHLRSGQSYDRNLQRNAHSVPSDLSRRLPKPQRHQKYVAIGGHVVLVDTVSNIIRDVIRLTDPRSH
jgi:Ni/Co efflux regulator RcnB